MNIGSVHGKDSMVVAVDIDEILLRLLTNIQACGPMMENCMDYLHPWAEPISLESSSVLMKCCARYGLVRVTTADKATKLLLSSPADL